MKPQHLLRNCDSQLLNNAVKNRPWTSSRLLRLIDILDHAIYILHIGCAFGHISVAGYIEKGRLFVKMS